MSADGQRRDGEAHRAVILTRKAETCISEAEDKLQRAATKLEQRRIRVAEKLSAISRIMEPSLPSPVPPSVPAFPPALAPPSVRVAPEGEQKVEALPPPASPSTLVSPETLAKQQLPVPLAREEISEAESLGRAREAGLREASTPAPSVAAHPTALASPPLPLVLETAAKPEPASAQARGASLEQLSPPPAHPVTAALRPALAQVQVLPVPEATAKPERLLRQEPRTTATVFSSRGTRRCRQLTWRTTATVQAASGEVMQPILEDAAAAEPPPEMAAVLSSLPAPAGGTDAPAPPPAVAPEAPPTAVPTVAPAAASTDAAAGELSVPTSSSTGRGGSLGKGVRALIRGAHGLLRLHDACTAIPPMPPQLPRELLASGASSSGRSGSGSGSQVASPVAGGEAAARASGATPGAGVVSAASSPTIAAARATTSFNSGASKAGRHRGLAATGLTDNALGCRLRHRRGLTSAASPTPAGAAASDAAVASPPSVASAGVEARSVAGTWRREEQRQHIIRLGVVRLPGEEELLRVLEEAIGVAPLPPPWQLYRDARGRVFFANSVTGIRTWSHPLDDALCELAFAVRQCLADRPGPDLARAKGLMELWQQEAQGDMARWHSLSSDAEAVGFCHSTTGQVTQEPAASVFLPAYWLKLWAFKLLLEDDGAGLAKLRRMQQTQKPLYRHTSFPLQPSTCAHGRAAQLPLQPHRWAGC